MEVFQNISLLHKKSVGLFRGCITRAPDCIEYAESGAHLHCVIKSLYKVLHAWARQFTQNHHSHQKICSQSESRRLFTWREEDPQTRKILEDGSSQRHNVFCIRFIHAKGCTCPQRQDLLTCEIGRSQYQEDPSTMLTAFTRKILELGTNRAKMGAGRTVNHMDQNFCMLTKRIVVRPSSIFLHLNSSQDFQQQRRTKSQKPQAKKV